MTRVLATTLSSILVFLLGVGIVSASTSATQRSAAGLQNTAQGSAAALQNAARRPTILLGFNKAPGSVRVGGQLADTVRVSPSESRTVYVQYRRTGTRGFTTAYHQKTSPRGWFTAYLMPRAAGRWQFRLVVVGTTRAKPVISPMRTVTASGRATTTKILGFASTPTFITVGATVRDAVRVSPRASRTVEVQVRRARTTTWRKTSTSGRSSTAGNFVATYRPSVGVWQYRLVVRASATARTAVSATRTVTARRSADTTAPRPVTALRATATDSSIRLTWTNPTNLDFTGVTIRRANGPTPPASRSGGTAVTGGVKTASSYTDTGLTADRQYSYAVFAHDGALNHSVAATWTGRTSVITAPGATGTTAVLATSSDGVDTTHITAGGLLFFVASDSHAGSAGVTLASATLDFGDDTAVKVFSGDQTSWFETHSYVATGTYQAKLTVTDSANVTVTKVVRVTVSPVPTASITIEGNQTSAQVGAPVTFTLTRSTPPGTTITSWTVGDDWLDGGFGTPPPATVTHTFTTPGTYTVRFDVSNDAMGTAHSSMQVTIAP